MGYRQDAKEHAFIRIEKDIRSDKIKNLILLCGVEEYLVKWASERLADHFVPEALRAVDLVELDGEDCDIDEIINACETLPMMSDRRVVKVRDFPLVWKNSSKRYSQKSAEIISNYVRDIPKHTLLIFESGADPERGGSRSTLLKAVVENGAKYDFGLLDSTQLRAYINKRLKAAGKTAERKAVDMLMWESGYFSREADYALFNLEQDIKKIIAISSDSEITAEDVERGISNSLEHDVFKMIDAIGSKKKREAFILFNDIVKSGGKTFQIISIIISQFELMLQALELRETGLGIKEMRTEIGVKSEYRLKKALSMAGGFTVSDLRRILIQAFEIDDIIKSGLLSDTMAIEMFIANI